MVLKVSLNRLTDLASARKVDDFSPRSDLICIKNIADVAIKPEATRSSIIENPSLENFNLIALIKVLFLKHYYNYYNSFFRIKLKLKKV